MYLQNVKKKVLVFRAHGHKACMYFYNHDIWKMKVYLRSRSRPCHRPSSNTMDGTNQYLMGGKIVSIIFHNWLIGVMHDKSNPYLKTISDGRNQYLMEGKIVFHYFLQLANRCYTWQIKSILGGISIWCQIHINTMYRHTLGGGHAVHRHTLGGGHAVQVVQF